jgi:integration host factor subunit beta
VNITKLDLAVRVAKRLNKPVTESKLVIETFLDEVMNVLTDDHRIEIRGFGVFKTKTRKSRRGRNPRTGESVQVPSYVAPTFKFSKDGQKNFDEKIMTRASASVPAYSSKSKAKKKKAAKPTVPAPVETVQTTKDPETPSAPDRSAETFSPV